MSETLVDSRYDVGIAKYVNGTRTADDWGRQTMVSVFRTINADGSIKFKCEGNE